VQEDEFLRIPGELELLTNAADRALAKHMQDPNYVPLAERTDSLRNEYKRRPVERLPEDLTRAFDRIARAERERDRLASRVIKLETAASSFRTRIWVLGAVAGAEFITIGWLANALLRRLH
jgi:chemotaxis methyl-accepting protein methylase